MEPRFFLMRHGEAERGSVPDAERRLTPAGRDGVRALARSLRAELRLARIRSSPLARARETAEILAEETGAPLEVEPSLAPGLLTGSGILALGAASSGTALVGHNPEMAEAVVLAAGGDQALPPGAIAAVGQDLRLLWIRLPHN